MSSLLYDAFQTIFPSSVYGAAKSYGKRSQYALQAPAASSAQVQSSGSSSTDIPTLVLSPIDAYIKKARNESLAAEKLAKELSVNLDPVDHLRNITYGHITNVFDNKQGRCDWLSLGAFNPNDFDSAVGRYWIAETSDAAAQLYYSITDLDFKNMATTKCEIDCWELWPKFDIPTNAAVPSYTFFVGVDPSFLTAVAYSVTDNMLVAPAAVGTVSADWANATTAPAGAFLANEYLQTPYELRQNVDSFHIVHKATHMLNPGDEWKVQFAMHHQFIYPFGQVQGARVDDTTRFFNDYAWMKRCGPLYVFRFRGRLSHDESKQVGTPGAGTNFGLYNIEYAYTRHHCLRKAYGRAGNGPRYADLQDRSTEVNLCTVANSSQWLARGPSDSAAQT